MSVKRITRDAILLALMCVMGMFSLPMGENIKVSLQFLILLVIFGIVDDIYDRVLIPGLYLLIGLVVPIYAGFMAGITPTFGFVLSFIVSAIPFHFIYKYVKLNFYFRFVLASLAALLVVYIGGSIFMMYYLQFDLGKTLLIAVVPYIPFDIAKIVVATLVVKLLPTTIKPEK